MSTFSSLRVFGVAMLLFNENMKIDFNCQQDYCLIHIKINCSRLFSFLNNELESSSRHLVTKTDARITLKSKMKMKKKDRKEGIY